MPRFLKLLYNSDRLRTSRTAHSHQTPARLPLTKRRRATSACKASKANQSKAAKMPRRRPTIKFRTSFANTIYDVMTARGWKETDSDTDWDFHCALAASRRVEAPSLHSNDSCPSHDDVGGFFVEFE